MIEKYLKTFLAQKGKVSISGLGEFSLEYHKPKVDPKSKKISPPSKEIAFKWNPKATDSGFEAYLAKSQKIKAAEAKANIKMAVSDLLKKLEKSQKVSWREIGEFSGDPKNVVFKSAGKNLHRSAAGLSNAKSAEIKSAPAREEAPKKVSPAPEPKKEDKKPVIAPVVTVKKEETPPVKATPPIASKPEPVKTEEKKKEEPKEQEEEKKGSLVWLWIVLIVLLAGSAITLYFVNKADTTKQVEQVQPEPEPEPDPEPEPQVEEPPPPPPKVLTISEKTGRYYVIAGGFSNKDNAMRMRDELEGKGAGEAKVIFPYPPKNLYRVSIEDHPSLDEAVAAMQKLRADYGNYIWVLTY